MKIVMLFFVCMVSPDSTSAMRPGFQIPPGPSVGSSNRSVDNYDLPAETIIYIRVTAEIVLFGNLRVIQGYRGVIGYSSYGHVFVYGDAMRTIGDTQERVKYGTDLDAWVDCHRPESEICDIIGLQESHLVYIQRPGLPPLISTLYPRMRLSGTRKVTFIGQIGTPLSRGPLKQVAPNEPIWVPWQVARNEPEQSSSSQQPSTPQQLPAPGGSTTEEMNFQPDKHILLRGSKKAFRFENGRFCRGQEGTLEKTDPEEGDIVTQSGAPIGRFRAIDQKWYPLNLRPRK